MREFLEQIFNAADASIDHTGKVIPTSLILYLSVQAVLTGSSSGTLLLQGSNDIVPITNPLTEPTNWFPIPSATVTITGTAGVFVIPLTNICYEYVQLVYTHNNGSAGTITANVKGLGA